MLVQVLMHLKDIQVCMVMTFSDTIAFHAVLVNPGTINFNETVVFNSTVTNEGGG